MTTQEKNILALTRDELETHLKAAQAKGCMRSLANQMFDLRPDDREYICQLMDWLT